jgi:hypothetical protein
LRGRGRPGRGRNRRWPGGRRGRRRLLRLAAQINVMVLILLLGFLVASLTARHRRKEVRQIVFVFGHQFLCRFRRKPSRQSAGRL